MTALLVLFSFMILLPVVLVIRDPEVTLSALKELFDRDSGVIDARHPVADAAGDLV